MKTVFSLILAVAFMGFSEGAFSRATKVSSASGKKSNQPDPTVAAGCTKASGATELKINNIRLLIQSGGDMWWDFDKPKFEVPKNSGKHSMFSGALWMGGMDVSGQLKVAAQMYRATGVDFWTGPLSTTTSEIDAATCTEWDKQYYLLKDEIKEFKDWYDAGILDDENGTSKQATDFPNYTIPQSVLNWPAHGRNYEPYNEDFYLAPFYDRNGDGVYDPFAGDYPRYDFNNEIECNQTAKSKARFLSGDETLWWIFNDKGNTHTETGSTPIGMEVRAQAFSFATNDEINTMTFANYVLVNRSTFTLTDTYFGVFADADLGGANDDFVGCDVMRGLGYCYNSDAFDDDIDGAKGYGDQPPAIGIDFFEGPFQDEDGIDNAYGIGYNEALNGTGYGDGVVDNERFGMRRFLFFSREGPSCCVDPTSGTQYYNYMRGIWRDGSKMVYGGNGHVSTQPSGMEADFMFPENTDDTYHWGTKGVNPGLATPWVDNNANDRRFVESAGPFTLTPGAVNDITVGIVWAQSTTGGPSASVEAMIRADTKTQALFDNCFRLIEGPHAPDLEIVELDKKLIIHIVNTKSSNNYGDTYEEEDRLIPIPEGVVLTEEEKKEYRTYAFQGYKVYQVSGDDVGVESLDDVSKARLILQCDIKDNVSQIINYEYDKNLGSTVPTEMVDGENLGVKHSFVVTEDQFSTGDKNLVNHKTYYFMAISYAYNKYPVYDPENPSSDSQKKPYLESRKASSGAIQSEFGIPHNTDLENDGTVLHSSYGDEVDIKRVEGLGNSGRALKLSQASIDEIMSGEPWKTAEVTYEKGYTPITVKVIDPINVVGDDFTVSFLHPDSIDTDNDGKMDEAVIENFSEATWKIERKNASDGEEVIVESENVISVGYEQLIPQWGISISMENVQKPGKADNIATGDNGFITAWTTFKDNSKKWLTGVPDEEGTSKLNWIRSGVSTEPADYLGLDSSQVYEGILGGTWTATRLASNDTMGPLMTTPAPAVIWQPGNVDPLINLHGVDIVFTADKSKWTRCPVIEQNEFSIQTENKGLKGRLRNAASVDKDGNAYVNFPADTTPSSSENDPNYISAYGMGWFPGYAIDVETGERLNMAFGEDSWLQGQNGRDMIWNPTDVITAGLDNAVRGGGRHIVHVFRNNVVEDESGFPYQMSNPAFRMPSYDYGAFLFKMLEVEAGENLNAKMQAVYRASMWTGWPLLAPGSTLLETDVTISIRVKRPFTRFAKEEFFMASGGAALASGQDYLVVAGPVEYQGKEYNPGQIIIGDGLNGITLLPGGGTSPSTQSYEDVDKAIVSVANKGLGLFNFGTHDLAAEKGRLDVARAMLDKINIVPNPYYAYSEYETGTLDNRVKIVNLPEKCNVSIYSINGTLIRQFSKDDPTISSIDWDLKNTARITVASGVYIVYVDVPGLGTKTLKWFGTMRPYDLNSF